MRTDELKILYVNVTGHVLFEMCAGYELTTPQPSASNLSDIENYPQVPHKCLLRQLQIIFNLKLSIAIHTFEKILLIFIDRFF